MTAQDRTLDHYQELMTINATSHVLRAAREIGLLGELAEGQKTLQQLSETLQLTLPRVSMLVQTLRAIGVIEQYGDDFALSSTARLLCQYDADLGDATWNQLVGALRNPESDPNEPAPLPRDRFDSIAATQWVHTPAAMQVAEILDLGGSVDGDSAEDDSAGQAQADPATTKLLDLGCGSAVWSCAMAHRDKSIHITAVDSESALAAATATAGSIDLLSRFETQVGDVLSAELQTDAYDIVVVAQRLNALAPVQIERTLARCFQALRSGGRLVVIDSFRGPNRPSLAESLEALRMTAETVSGEIPELEPAQARLKQAGLENVQFTFIAASRIGLGLMTGVKP